MLTEQKILNSKVSSNYVIPLLCKLDLFKVYRQDLYTLYTAEGSNKYLS